MLPLNTIEAKTDEYRGNEIPVDLIDIVEKLGYKAYYLDEDSITIAGKVDHKTKKIFVNPNDNVVRQRFTIAHEIGHIVLHKNANTQQHYREDSRFSVYSDDIEEIEANRFASVLLMPAKEFRKKWNEYHNSVVEVANYFGVSKLSASIRANNLNLIKL